MLSSPRCRAVEIQDGHASPAVPLLPPHGERRQGHGVHPDDRAVTSAPGAEDRRRNSRPRAPVSVDFAWERMSLESGHKELHSEIPARYYYIAHTDAAAALNMTSSRWYLAG